MGILIRAGICGGAGLLASGYEPLGVGSNVLKNQVEAFRPTEVEGVTLTLQKMNRIVHAAKEEACKVCGGKKLRLTTRDGKKKCEACESEVGGELPWQTYERLQGPNGEAPGSMSPHELARTEATKARFAQLFRPRQNGTNGGLLGAMEGNRTAENRRQKLLLAKLAKLHNNSYAGLVESSSVEVEGCGAQAQSVTVSSEGEGEARSSPQLFACNAALKTGLFLSLALLSGALVTVMVCQFVSLSKSRKSVVNA